MFRKIISNLPFSPALVGQLGFYAKRLRKEETTRRLGLIFLALAIVVQSFAVFEPPESANASSSNDIIRGGCATKECVLSGYDNNTQGFRDFLNYFGITRDEISNGTWTGYSGSYSIRSSEWPVSFGRNSYNNRDGSISIGGNTYYYGHLADWDTNGESWYAGLSGYSAKAGEFNILANCGNLELKKLPPSPPPAKCVVNSELLASDENCKPCPGNSTLWIDDPACIPNIVKSKTATNTSQGFVNATSVTAKAGDQISYTITIENNGLNQTSVSLQDDLSDILEYATLIDKGGGTLDSKTGILSWSDITLNSNDKQTRTFVIRVMDTIPATARGSSNVTSYDCKMLNTFGNSVSINVDCPAPKVIEKVATELPTTGPTENLLFAGVVLAISTYFYARARQTKKEVRLVRRDISVGTI